MKPNQVIDDSDPVGRATRRGYPQNTQSLGPVSQSDIDTLLTIDGAGRAAKQAALDRLMTQHHTLLSVNWSDIQRIAHNRS